MDMKRLVAMAMVAGVAMAAVAMPTKAELQKAQELVTDVTASDMKALRAKTKKPAEVAARHMEFAAQAASEAEKFLLLQGAFKLYVKAEDYENAANALTTMSRSISNLNPEVIVEIYNNVIFRSMKEKSPKLYAIKESARRQVFFRAQLVKAEAAVKADPKNVKAQRRLGECHAELGDWPQALEAFSNADGELAKIAKSEKGGATKPQELGDFWWDYETKSDTPTYRLHAAELYRKALADTSFNGLARTRAEQRVKESEKDVEYMVMCSSKAESVISPIPTAKLADFASRTFDLGCERKLEMIACPAGTFTMGEKTVAGDCNEVRKHQVKITRPFWLSKVAITRGQWAKILYGEVKDGKVDGHYDFPAVNSSLGNKCKLLSMLNNVFKSEMPKGYVFRLPTEAELAYAMTSGGRDKVTELSVGVLGPSVADKRREIDMLKKNGVNPNRVGENRATRVGTAKPNTWGFYDVINNGETLVLDRIAPNSKMRKLKNGKKETIVNISYEDVETDPLCWDIGEKDVQSLCCDQSNFWGRHTHFDWGWNETFRVCLGPDLVAEKNAIQKKTGAWPISTPADNDGPVKTIGGERSTR